MTSTTQRREDRLLHHKPTMWSPIAKRVLRLTSAESYSPQSIKQVEALGAVLKQVISVFLFLLPVEPLPAV